MVVSQRFRADARPHKLDLGVGVYRDADGSASVLKVVKQAEALLVETQATKSYLPSNGDSDFVDLMGLLVLGADSAALSDGRLASAQCPGGTGAFHQALALIKQTTLKQAGKSPAIWVGMPTWPNHLPMLRHQGLAIETYDYYDVSTQSLQFDAMMTALQRAVSGDVVLLHGVCPNPTGADLDLEQWTALTTLIKARGLVPLFDFAYQGFGSGSAADAVGVRMMVEQLPEVLIAASCSKSFGLYRERTGILLVLCERALDVVAVAGSLQLLARLNYSNPPDHGAAIVRTILSDAGLKQRWANELTQMRERVVAIRLGLMAEGQRQSYDLDFVGHQTGLFTTFAISEAQTLKLAEQHAIHLPGTGRINISGLSEVDLPHFVAALKAV